MQVGISGTGRIGRLVLRRAFTQCSDLFQITVVNSTSSPATLAHLLKYDTVHGTWDADVQAGEDEIVIDGRRVVVTSERDPSRIPWKRYGIELAIDATGRYADREGLTRHLDAGARRALLTSPGQDMDLTMVIGVNEHRYDPARHRLLSAASCTTNCLAPILGVLDRAFGVRRGWATTVHAFTNDQNHLDNPHKDLRRARACTSSIIPTSSGVSRSLADVLPHLAPRVSGRSVRVPVPDVSLLDLLVDLGETVRVEEVRRAFLDAAAGEMRGVLDYNELPLVSSDYIGNDKSAVIDGLSLTKHESLVNIMAWYDNEWAYACRVIDTVRCIAQAEQRTEEGEDHAASKRDPYRNGTEERARHGDLQSLQ